MFLSFKLQNTHILGLYKPTIAPSKYDPYYIQITGSSPSHLDQNSAMNRSLPYQHILDFCSMPASNISEVTSTSRSTHHLTESNNNNELKSKHFENKNPQFEFSRSSRIGRQQPDYSDWTNVSTYMPRCSNSGTLTSRNTSDSTVVHQKHI